MQPLSLVETLLYQVVLASLPEAKHVAKRSPRSPADRDTKC